MPAMCANCDCLVGAYVWILHYYMTSAQVFSYVVKLRQGSGKDRQGMAVKAKGLKA